MPYEVSKDANKFTETKRKITERAGTLQTGRATDAGPNAKKPGLAGLSFKKNKSTADAADKQSSVDSSATLVEKSSGSLFLPDNQNAQVIESPVSAHGGWGQSHANWDSAGGWGASGEGSWGNSADWDIGRQSPQEARYPPTSLLSPSTGNTSSFVPFPCVPVIHSPNGIPIDVRNPRGSLR
jgi:hypothetical protein